jgi:hypothetical protein
MNKSMNAVDDDFDCVKVEVFHKCFLFHEITRDAKVSVQMSRPIVYKRKALEA